MHRLAIGILLLTAAFSQVPDGYQVSGVIPLNAPESFIQMTSTPGALCANTYVFNASNALIGCCASLITPGKLYLQSTRRLSTDFSLSAPDAVIAKVLASAPIGGQGCNAASPTAGTLVAGMRISLNGTPFQASQLSPCVTTSPNTPCMPELQMLTSFCSFIQQYGSGTGLCGQATVGNTLNVVKGGTGTGRVTGGGLDCGDACSGLAAGSIALTATSDAGSQFLGWGGACSGLATCTVDPRASDQTVTANFASATNMLILFWFSI